MGSSLNWITFVSTRDEKHAVTEWCPACRIPLCAMCKVRVKKRPIPAALGNDNLLGCPPASLYAVASPVYTACVSFYLENDFGHLPEQELHSAKNAVAVRGTIASLEMPWAAITDQVLENVETRSCRLNGP